MKKSSILIVEDDLETTRLLEYYLSNLGYRICAKVRNGNEALKIAASDKPDLVLMDIILEGKLDGIETANAIQKENDIPVVYLTAHEDEELFHRAKVTNPYGYIVKPCSQRDLHISVEVAIYKSQQKDKLKQAHDYAKNIIDSSLNMIIAVDNQRHIIEFNRAAEDTFGYKRDEVIGKHINLLYADTDQGAIIHQKTIKDGRCIDEILNRNKKGEVFPSLLVASILRGSDDKPAGVMGISQDITELKITQKALKESQEYARNIINSSLDMIIAVDNNRKITEFNQAAENTFGYTRKEIIGRPVDILYANSKEGKFMHSTTVTKGRLVKEIRNNRKNGEIFTSLLSASVLYNEAGEQMGIMGVSRDITELKQAQNQLKRSEKRYRTLSEQLSEANDFKALLLDIITHDLKNPAGVISGMTDILIDELGKNDIVKSINECSNNLLKVIDNAATLSNVVTGEEISKEEIDVNSLMMNITNEFSSPLENAGMVVELKLPKKLTIVANPIISEIPRNFISNMIKYAREGKRIIIEAESSKKSVSIFFKDFGQTIPIKQREMIFRRRVQLKNRKKMGRGLGLAIVKKIAEAHDAKYGVKPNKPKGNIFYIEIPK